jgi:hypothetical protein
MAMDGSLMQFAKSSCGGAGVELKFRPTTNAAQQLT